MKHLVLICSNFQGRTVEVANIFRRPMRVGSIGMDGFLLELLSKFDFCYQLSLLGGYTKVCSWAFGPLGEYVVFLDNVFGTPWRVQSLNKHGEISASYKSETFELRL